MNKWLIYYDNGSTFSNENGEPKNAPPEGVEIIVCLSDDKKPVMLFGAEHYFFRRYDDDFGEWFQAPTDFSAFTQLHKHVNEMESFISGRTMRSKSFEQLKRRAKRHLKFWIQESKK